MSDDADQKKIDEERAQRSEYFRHRTGGLIIAAAIFAYFAVPILEFANPLYMLLSGASIGAVIWQLYERYVLRDVSSNLMFWGSFLIMVVSFLYTMVEAIVQEHDNEIVCNRLISELLIPHQHRGDIASVYSALKCRPRYADTVDLNSLPQTPVVPIDTK